MQHARSIDDIRKEMNQSYSKAAGPYEIELPFDRLRTEMLRREVLILAQMMWSGSLTHEKPHTLDVGSGAAGIAEYWPHKNIVGVEISQVAVDKARARFPEVTYICSAIEDFWSDKPFQMAVAIETIEHWSDVDRGLEVIRKSLVPGSAFIVSSPNRDSLHCRIGKKLRLDVPYCSYEHTHEYGFHELIDLVAKHGFDLEHSQGVGLYPYWALEAQLGPSIRALTDKDEEVNLWLNELGHYVPPEYAFLQVHAFKAR